MPPLPADLFFSSIAELNQLLRTRQISARELAGAFGARLEKLGPRYNALALPLTGYARKKAKDVDGDIKRERFRGPVQGIPYGAKDLLSLARFPTTWGAKPYQNQVLQQTATALNKLNGSGALLIGKLAMVELAGGPAYRFASASLTGAGLNPWDTSRWSGGSSSGSAIAVAAGLAAFALGSETSGSILTPSAFCGVTGLRPTYGLVSRTGAMPLSWTLDKIGPIARSAEDCAHVLAAISGGDDEDPGSTGKRFYYFSNYDRAMKDLTIGFAEADFTDHADPSARPAFAEALNVLRSLGLRFQPASLPDFPYGAVISTVISSEAASVFEQFIRGGAVDQLADSRQIAAFKAALEIPAVDYLKAMRIRRLVQNAFNALFAEIDVLVSFSRPAPAPPVDQPLDAPPRSASPGTLTRGLGALIPAGNLAGLPALSLPCGFAGGLPVAIQLVGRPYSENLLIHIGKAFQNATDWHRRRPPVPV